MTDLEKNIERKKVNKCYNEYNRYKNHLKTTSTGVARTEPIIGLAVITEPKRRRMEELKETITKQGRKVMNAFPRGMSEYGIEAV